MTLPDLACEREQLLLWDLEGRLPAESYDRIKSHPAFGSAARALAQNMLDAAQQDVTLDGVFKDAGRYVCALWAFYLHVTGGLTLPRLKALCAQSGLVSPGRARALLLYLGYLGYFEWLPSRRRGEAAIYIPSAVFIIAWRRHIVAALAAVGLIEPAVRHVIASLDDPQILAAFATAQSEGLLAEAKTGNQHSPFFRTFVHPNAGSQILWVLITESVDGTFPPRSSGRISISGTARRLAVSRIHVTRIFRQAEQNGLLNRGADGEVTLHDTMRGELESSYATQLIRLLAAAARTMRTLPVN